LKVAIIQPLYLPWCGFFEMIATSDAYVAFDHVQFDKTSWQQRNRLKGANGPFYISVPILKDKFIGNRICDKRIDYSKSWRIKHVRSLELWYKKAPYFNQYFPELKAKIEMGMENIADLNVSLIRLLLRFLGIEREVIRSSELPLGNDSNLGKNERVINLMKTIGANQYYEGASGRNFIDPKKFEAEGMSVSFQSYRHPIYPQQHKGFFPYMSVVDLLFNCGEKSFTILKSGNVLAAESEQKTIAAHQ